MGKTFRIPAWIFSIIGILVLLLTKAPFSQWVYGFNSMLKSVIILIAIQPLSIAIEAGHYETAADVFLNRRIRRAGSLYTMIAMLEFLLAGIMNLGSVVVLLATILPVVNARISKGGSFASKAVSTGYSSLFLWAPGAVTVLISLQSFGLSWSEYFPAAFLLGIIELLAGCLYGIFVYRRIIFSDTAPSGSSEALPAVSAKDPVQSRSFRQILELILVMVLIVIGIFLLDRTRFSHATGRMVLATLVISIVWLILLTKKEFLKIVPELWWNRMLPKNADMYTFFLAMGLFSAAVSYSGVENQLLLFLSQYKPLLGSIVIWFLPLAVILLALVGIHPFISAVILGQILSGMGLPETALQLSLALSLGCCLSYMISPFSGLILTLSNKLDQSPFELCFRNHSVLALLLYLTGISYISFVR
jgi:hypothetical protein